MQEIGETRLAMTRDVMNRIEKIINDVDKEEYYILVHGKPFPNHPHMIKMKYLIMDRRPSMMLSCMLFKVDNRHGKLTLEWALPGDWPTWSTKASEPVSETIASYDRLEKKLKFQPGNSFFESRAESLVLSP